MEMWHFNSVQSWGFILIKGIEKISIYLEESATAPQSHTTLKISSGYTEKNIKNFFKLKIWKNN